VTNPNFQLRRTGNIVSIEAATETAADTPIFDAADLAAAAQELTRDRWRVARFELTAADGFQPEPAHLEAYRNIISYDLSTGGPEKVARTLATELPGIRLTGVRATKMYRQTEHDVIIRADGTLRADEPATIIPLLTVACSR
jgi:hypothetical protein